jgi:hypothetical protein
LCAAAVPQWGSLLPAQDKMFVFRYMRFLFDETLADFVPIAPLECATTQELQMRMKRGLVEAVRTFSPKVFCATGLFRRLYAELYH